MEPPSSMELKVMSCNGINVFNFFQKLCTYVTVSIVSEDPKEKQKKRNHDKQKTPIDREGDGDPEWKHDIRFDLKQILSSSALTSLDHMFVHFDILAEGFLGDKSVGQVVVPLKELILESHGGGATRFISYQVRGSDGKPNGTLNFSYKVVGNEISSTFQNNNNNPAIVYPPVQAVAPPPSISYPPIDNYPSSPPMFYPPPIEVQHQHQHHHHHNPSTSSEVFYTAPPTPASPHTPTVSVADMFPYPPPQQHQLPLHYQPPPPAPAFPYGYGSGGFGYPHQPGFYPMTTIGYPHPNPYPYVDRPYGDTWHRENQHGGGSPGGSWRRIRKLFGRLKKRFR
ncbi:hypothetical protein C5167_022176 [Papaver somniferum]|uniref:C2 domain-containing protein n=1 Tax=Papaver somniferum TaxID=3469 RepID=A0A4Y7JH20_PAPSO|nr:protein SRC2-like [Papaver somniferum]RZC60414.1 hypothetical protein C5167_022176 [Papaver somniferum]